MEDIFITISGTSHYYGSALLKIGTVLKLRKDFDNPFDVDAISVSLPSLGIMGYVANSETTLANGTKSASEIYSKIADEAFCIVMFKTEKYIVAKILFGKEMTFFETF